MLAQHTKWHWQENFDISLTVTRCNTNTECTLILYRSCSISHKSLTTYLNLLKKKKQSKEEICFQDNHDLCYDHAKFFQRLIDYSVHSITVLLVSSKKSGKTNPSLNLKSNLKIFFSVQYKSCKLLQLPHSPKSSKRAQKKKHIKAWTKYGQAWSPHDLCKNHHQIWNTIWLIA